MTVSVIIPTHNRAGLITEAIDSVLAQTWKDIEIIVVDDGSTDETASVVKQYGDAVRYVFQSRKGPAAARNTGINLSSGELIAFLDSDDVWLPQKLSMQVDVMNSMPTVALVATAYGTITTEGKRDHKEALSRSEANKIRKSHYKNFFATSTVMVRRTCLKHVGLFEESLHFAEDWDLWIRILNRYDFRYLNTILTRYRKHPLNITGTSFSTNIQDWQRVIEIHRGGKTLKEWIVKKKRLSWLYLNMALVYRREDSKLEMKYLIKSISEYPFLYPKRYYSLLKLSLMLATKTSLQKVEK